jgi:hypothetical protein
MLVFSLTNGEKSFKYKIPETSAEVTCGQIVDFQEKIETKKPETLSEFEKTDTDDRADYISGLEEGEISRKWVSYYMRELMFWCGIPADVIGFIPVQSEDGNDLHGLRAILTKAFKPEGMDMDGKFDYKGHTFYLPPAPVNLIDPTRTDYLRGATLGEFATATELYKAYTSMLDGSCLALLNVIAVLCRKKGEKLPSLPDEQNDWIRERIEFFKGLDFQTAMNVGFFLSCPQVKSVKRSVFSRLVGSLRKRRKSMVTI